METPRLPARGDRARALRPMVEHRRRPPQRSGSTTRLVCCQHSRRVYMAVGRTRARIDESVHSSTAVTPVNVRADTNQYKRKSSIDVSYPIIFRKISHTNSSLIRSTAVVGSTLAVCNPTRATCDECSNATKVHGIRSTASTHYRTVLSNASHHCPSTHILTAPAT